ncbi:MAG: hypothetical protein ACLFO2_00490 [Candidatus Woesearchaeota archaeon]
MRGRRGASKALNLVITFIILAVLIVVYFALIKDYIVDTSADLKSCEKNGGHCLPLCSSGMTRMSAYDCPESQDVCCMDTEDVTGIQGTGLECEDVNGECREPDEGCEEGERESTADCEEGLVCCTPVEGAENECVESGGACMDACSNDDQELEASCPDEEKVCCG